MAGTTRARKAPTTRRPASVPPVLDIEDDGPVRISTKNAVELSRVPLFYIDDEEYTMLSPVPARIAMQFLRDLRNTHFEVALASLVANVMEDRSTAALAECDQLTEEEMVNIIGRVQNNALGATKKLQGK